MFYTYAEKQGNIFFDGWQMRQVAFDTMRRYLYYSAATLAEKHVVPAMDSDNPRGDPATTNASASTRSTLSTPATQQSPVSFGSESRSRAYSTAPPQPNLPSDIQWRKKIKVDYITLVAKAREYILEDTRLKETDLLQVEIQGESRVLQAGESPAPGPLLVNSAGWAGLPERFTVENEEYIADPFFLRELYEALRDQFATMRMERERLELSTGVTRDPQLAKVQTIVSPRGKGEPLIKGSRVKVVLRLRSEYEFRRFWFVVQSVLGYDKLGARPYRGLPPYDPRNGLIFAQVPMCVWHTFKALDKAVMYYFVRGDLVGRGVKGELIIFLRGAYLCITHDMVLVLRDTGNIPRWIRLQEVRTFEYNHTCQRPYFAFLSDPGAPDVVFIPQPPVYGQEAIRRFSPYVETMRARHVMRASCFASVVARRVIGIREAPESSIRAFVARIEAERGCAMNFDVVIGQEGPMTCPLPKEQLAAVWREVQGIFAARDPEAVSQAAIPLYVNNPNDSDLTPAQLRALEHRLERERETRYDIVGIPIDEARRVHPLRPRGGQRRTHSQEGRGERAGEAAGGLRRTRTTAGSDLRSLADDSYGASRGSGAAVSDSSRTGPSAGTAAAPAALAAAASSSSTTSAAAYTSSTGYPAEGWREGGPLTDGGGSLGASPNGGPSLASSSVVYGVPGARYLTETEVAGGLGGASPSYFVGDNHMVLAQTPTPGGRTAPYTQQPGGAGGSLARSVEVNVDQLMSHSLKLMRSTMVPPLDPPPPPGTGAWNGSPIALDDSPLSFSNGRRRASGSTRLEHSTTLET